MKNYILLTIGMFFCFPFISCIEDPPLVEEDPRDEICIKWTCQDDEQSVYDVIINKSSNEKEVLMKNFQNIGGVTKAILTNGVLTIHEQTVEGGYIIKGSGQVQNYASSIEWEYTVDNIPVTATFSPSTISKLHQNKNIVDTKKSKGFYLVSTIYFR